MNSNINQNAKKVLLVVTSHSDLGTTGKKTGYYLPEVSHPYYRLRDAGYEVDIGSPQGGTPPLDENSRNLEDPDNKRFLATAEDWSKMTQSLKLSEIDSSQYRGIVFAGGHGTMWDFADSADIQRLAAEIYEANGVVAAVCHGPAALVNVRLSNGRYLVAGKTVSVFTDEEERAAELTEIVPFLLEKTMRERGANIQKAALWQQSVAVDGRLVTGQNPASASELGKQVVRVLQSIN